jgi:hypothetical protein
MQLRDVSLAAALDALELMALDAGGGPASS